MDRIYFLSVINIIVRRDYAAFSVAMGYNSRGQGSGWMALAPLYNTVMISVTTRITIMKAVVTLNTVMISVMTRNTVMISVMTHNTDMISVMTHNTVI